MTDEPAFAPTFRGVLALLARLRGPDGCPWDRDQTPRSLVPHLIEEAHEVAAALEAGDDRATIDELGDLLLHLAFQIEIATEEGRFGLEDVAGRLIDKMIRRHPHVFADAEYTGDGHQAMWERLKRAERGAGGDGALGELPAGLPTLVRAHRLQQKAATVGFDWAAPEGAREKVAEELAEVDAAHRAETPRAVEEELGDLLFALVNWARLLGVHPDTALRRANRKFEERFRRLEALAAERGLALEDQPLEALDALWDEVKTAERP